MTSVDLLIAVVREDIAKVREEMISVLNEE